jgi:hypothetical protein
MRRRLLVFMVIVFTLRGWVGEAMAGQMLVMELAAAQAHAQPAEAPVAMPDCHMAMDTSAQGESGDGAICGSCLSCQACSLNALPAAAAAAPSSVAHARPQAVRVLVAKAPPAQSFKPPIS